MTAERERGGVAPPGHRLPAATRIGTVTLQVADLERSLEYYGRVLGLTVIAREPGRARLGPAGNGAALLELREHRGAAPVPRRGRLGLFHFAILVPDRAALGGLLRHLDSLDVRAGMADHLVSEAVYLTDPDGLGIEVYADRPRDAWRWSGGELVMTTEPLDVAGVTAAAEGRPWSGLPAGSTIGHLHLSVGDLAAASAYYHEGLGFDRMVWSYPGALFLAAGGYHHHLGTNIWAAGAPPAGPDDARLLEWEILVPTPGDAAAALESLRAAGATVEPAPGGGTSRDPWGTALRIRAQDS